MSSIDLIFKELDDDIDAFIQENGHVFPVSSSKMKDYVYRVSRAVSADPDEWFALDKNGTDIHIGDKVKTDSGVFEVSGFERALGRTYVRYTDDNFDAVDTVVRVSSDTPLSKIQSSMAVKIKELSYGDSDAETFEEFLDGILGESDGSFFMANATNISAIARNAYEIGKRQVEKSTSNSDMESESVDDLAMRTFFGEFGNGNQRREALGDGYNKVQSRLNGILSNMEEICRVLVRTGVYDTSEIINLMARVVTKGDSRKARAMAGRIYYQMYVTG